LTFLAIKPEENSKHESRINFTQSPVHPTYRNAEAVSSGCRWRRDGAGAGAPAARTR
jgi:hypothetical protein